MSLYSIKALMIRYSLSKATVLKWRKRGDLKALRQALEPESPPSSTETQKGFKDYAPGFVHVDIKICHKCPMKPAAVMCLWPLMFLIKLEPKPRLSIGLFPLVILKPMAW